MGGGLLAALKKNKTRKAKKGKFVEEDFVEGEDPVDDDYDDDGERDGVNEFAGAKAPVEAQAEDVFAAEPIKGKGKSGGAGKVGGKSGGGGGKKVDAEEEDGDGDAADGGGVKTKKGKEREKKDREKARKKEQVSLAFCWGVYVANGFIGCEEENYRSGARGQSRSTQGGREEG